MTPQEVTAASAMPAGTVTLLFTDIEGSTRHVDRLGADYATALADHHRILRHVFSRHAGREVSTAGDSFFVAFGRADDAVAAAADAQRVLAGHLWPGGAPLMVRIGVHAGSPTLWQDDYVGMDVHRCARVCAAGHGGQVLLSKSVVSTACCRPPRTTRMRPWSSGPPRRFAGKPERRPPPMRS